MSSAANTDTIRTVRKGATYYRTAETEMTAPGFHLAPGDSPRRWNIVDDRTGKAVALFSIV